MPIEQEPHRPGPLHQTNKAYKGGRHSRKSTATSEIRNKCISKPAPQLAREERLNQATQSRKLRRERVIEEKRKLGSESYPPLVIGVLDLYKNSSLSFIDGIKKFGDESIFNIRKINDRATYVISSRLKMRFKLIALDASNFDETLDIVKSLDLMVLLHYPSDIQNFQYSNSQLFKSIYIHCLPSIVHVLDSTRETNDSQSSKSLINAKKVLRSTIKEEKIHHIEKDQDYLQLFHILGNCKRQKSQFKDARPSVVTDEVSVVGNSLTFSGFVRKKVLSPNDLIHIIGYGDYQIEKIDILPDVVALRPTSLQGTEVVQTLRPDPMKQETLEQENDIDPMEGEQTWPTAEELATEAERRNTKKIIKKLPPGTSAYQGAWIPGDSDEGEDVSESSDDDDGDKKMEEILEENVSSSDSEEDEHEGEEFATNHDENSLMDVDEYDKNNSKEKEMKILEKLREARVEEMFPDEIDTPNDIAARLRFARYRGLKSFRTSHWDPQENLPPDYSRIFQFQNFHQTKRRVISERTKEGADPGQYVRIYLTNVPSEVTNHILSRSNPPSLVGLLKYERKMTVMNILIKRLQDSDLKNPIQSKDELIFYVGFRKFKARPSFTTHSVSSKFKYERFFRDDVAMVATIYAPITFPPAPVLVFRPSDQGDHELVASGSVLDSNPNRLIIKRIRLSGHPFKIHSKSAVVRFMFFNSEDVLYFKPVELTTKYNRRGHISEPLGTHGHMKCLFDKKIRSDDCIFMNLYKRVFPKWTYTPISLV